MSDRPPRSIDRDDRVALLRRRPRSTARDGWANANVRPYANETRRSSSTSTSIHKSISSRDDERSSITVRGHSHRRVTSTSIVRRPVIDRDSSLAFTVIAPSSSTVGNRRTVIAKANDGRSRRRTGVREREIPRRRRIVRGRCERRWRCEGGRRARGRGRGRDERRATGRDAKTNAGDFRESEIAFGEKRRGEREGERW